jgi:tRNA U34 5-carboxymethylaminomethyl modifying GTPase MnmE/TrmE
VEQADVIIEVLDARDPLGCRTRKVEEMILQAVGQKRIILLLNKVDLVPRLVVDEWLTYLRKEFPTVAFKASTQQQRDNLGQSSVDVHVASDRTLSGSECVGADQLVQLLESPVFTFLRLSLLEPDPYLLKCMYSLLMLLPQSSAFVTLRNRLSSVAQYPMV